MSLHDRKIDYTTIPEAWHERFPIWQHWGINTHLHLCMTAGSSKAPGWTSTTKRPPLSLQLWHKHCPFSPVLHPKMPALILQKKCQTRVTQPSKPSRPAPMKVGQHWPATAWHTHTYLPNTKGFSKVYHADCMFTPLTFPPLPRRAQKWPPWPPQNFWWTNPSTWI